VFLPKNREEEYDKLAQAVRKNLNLPLIYEIIGMGKNNTNTTNFK
jgi:hypothetical protein